MTLNRANIIKLNDDDDDDDNKIKKATTLEAKVKTKKLDDKIKSEILKEEIKRRALGIAEDFEQLFLDGYHGIQRLHGFLKDASDFGTTDFLQIGQRNFRQIQRSIVPTIL